MTSFETETFMCMQARESASRDMLAVKDAHIAALCTELRGKDRMLQAKTRVCTPSYYSHHHTVRYYMYCVCRDCYGLSPIENHNNNYRDFVHIHFQFEVDFTLKVKYTKIGCVVM